MQTKKDRCLRICLFYGAGDEARTRYLHLGKVALYRMSYTRRNKVYYSKDSNFVKSLFFIFLILFFYTVRYRCISKQFRFACYSGCLQMCFCFTIWFCCISRNLRLR